MKEQTTEAAIAAAAQKASLGAGTAAVFGGLTANEIAAFGGLVIALIGLCVQWYYKRKDDRRREELHAAQLQLVRDEHEELRGP